MSNYLIEQLDEINPVDCPCGRSRRAFVGPGNTSASLHLTDISRESRIHYHQRLTEIYLILEGEGHMERDRTQIPVKPFTSILIKPLCRHRAVGKLKVAITSIPVFDPGDEWFDD